MKIVRYKNPNVTTVKTNIISDIDINTTEIEVVDSSSFSVGDFVLIEEVGHEYCEIVKISNITGNVLQVSTTNLPHINNTFLTKINYDKYIIQRSYDNETYVLLHTGELDYSEVYNNIFYIDESADASDKLYYKVLYYNSETATTDEQIILHNEKNYGYITVDEFRRDTSFSKAEVSDSEVEKAIYKALEWIQDNAYVYHEFNEGIDNTFVILSNLEFADWNGDSVIDKNDVIVYEFDQRTLTRRYLSDKLVKVFPKSKKLLFSETVPTNPANQLVIKIPMTFKQLGTIKATLAAVSKLIATNHILRDVDTSKIKGGITSWNAGGTNVNRDLSSLENSINKNLETARRLLTQICKLYTRRTTLRTEQSSLNVRQRYNSFYTSVSRRF